MKKVTITERQSILDIALQHGGSFEAAHDIAQLNDLSMTDDLCTGSQLETPVSDNKEVADYYAVNDLHPASSITDEQILEILDTGEGIEFWSIEFDFIVSESENTETEIHTTEQR